MGTLVLAMKKGTLKHKRVGYLYLASMAIMLTTSFMIYRLFKSFGIIHALSILSSVTILLGMYPVLVKKSGNYIFQHFKYMYWSIMGLYAAFIAEMMVRIPFLPMFREDFKPTSMFFNIVGVAVGAVMIFAAVYFKKKKTVWLKQFNALEK